MCYYNNLCLPDGRARRQARKKFLAARLALAPPPVAGDKRRVNAGRARRGGLGRGRFRGTFGEARGRSARGGAGPKPRADAVVAQKAAAMRARLCGPGRRPLQALRRRAGFAGPATGSPLAAPGGKEYLAPATNARRCTRPPSECPQAVGGRDAVGRRRRGNRWRRRGGAFETCARSSVGRATDF